MAHRTAVDARPRSRGCQLVVVAGLLGATAPSTGLPLRQERQCHDAAHLAFATTPARAPRAVCQAVVARRASAFVEPPPTEELVVALGRELWQISDELLEASLNLYDSGEGPYAKEKPMALAQSANALRNAAEGMMEDDLDTAWGELEVAACACEFYLPQTKWQGLVDLFSYEETCSRSGWQDARNSLRQLGASLASTAARLEKAQVTKSAEQMKFASQRLQLAARMFEPGGFYMPPDPREARYNFPGGWDVKKEPQDDEALIRDLAPGSYAATLATEVRQELARAALGTAARRAVLRRLVRRTHPDQNPGREEEVVPVLRYVQRIRDREGVRR